MVCLLNCNIFMLAFFICANNNNPYGWNGLMDCGKRWYVKLCSYYSTCMLFLAWCQDSGATLPLSIWLYLSEGPNETGVMHYISISCARKGCKTNWWETFCIFFVYSKLHISNKCPSEQRNVQLTSQLMTIQCLNDVNITFYVNTIQQHLECSYVLYPQC